jgi:NAD(P)-dependent dehydrogenase (short-subunit alcohol dehydrogenase family)
MTVKPTGHVAMVTGASRGIGRSLAVGLAEFGYDVTVLDLPMMQSELEETARQVEAHGRKAYVMTMDVTLSVDIERVVSDTISKAGGIDVLVNNAGILKPSLLENLSDDDWDKHMDVNGKGVFMMCKAVVAHMRAKKSGRIINIASIAGRQGVATQGHYAATKSTVITLTRVLAQELGMDGITVNAICPGIILTEMGKNNLGSDEAIRHWETVAALKRLGDPQDIVGPACFFASNLSDFVTGQALNVDGGIYFH